MDISMNFTNIPMEELIPITGRLAELYTGGESTTITYEKANQLMGAVLYCIREAAPQNSDGLYPAAGAGTISAELLYKTGAGYVEEKVRKALSLYNEMLPDFACYGSRCLHDTFVLGLPGFFKWYDMKFHPQDTILTLDYPVLKDLSALTGIDRIYEFILCIRQEQSFLARFPEEDIIGLLSHHNSEYQDAADNICETILTAFAGHILSKKPLTEQTFETEDYLRIRNAFQEFSLSDICRQINAGINIFMRMHHENDTKAETYFSGAVRNIAIRIKNAAEHEKLNRLF